jgi:hypothetical protein
LKKIIKWFEKNKKISLIGLIITFCIMFYVSSIKGSSIKGGSIWLSVGYHMTIFAVFAFFLFVFFSKPKEEVKTITLAILMSLIFGILDEIHQIFVPFRSANLEDVIIDLTGAIISVSILTLIKRSK